MDVSLLGLQKSLHYSFQDFSGLLKNALKKDVHGEIVLNPRFDEMSELQDAFDELRNDIVIVCSLIDPDNGDCLTKDDKINFNLVDFVEFDEDE